MKGEWGGGERGGNRKGKGEGRRCYLDSIGRLFESDQHIPVPAAGRIPGAELQESGWGAGGRTGRVRGTHRARLRGGEGAPPGPAAPLQYRTRRGHPPTPPPTHTDRLRHTARGRSPGPGRARLAAHARPRGGGGGPRARQLPQSGPRHLRLAAPAALPATPAARGPPGRGRRPGSVSRYLHEGLYRAFGRVQVGGAQMAALVHRGRRVYQEQ